MRFRPRRKRALVPNITVTPIVSAWLAENLDAPGDVKAIRVDHLRYRPCSKCDSVGEFAALADADTGEMLGYVPTHEH